MSEQERTLFDIAEKIAIDAQTCERIAISTRPVDLKALGKREGLRLAKQYVIEAALRAQQERENPQPLTIEDLSKLASKDPVWGSHCFVKSLESGKVFHAIVDIDSNGIVVIIGAHKTLLMDTYGTLWIAYAHEPKGEHHE